MMRSARTTPNIWRRLVQALASGAFAFVVIGAFTDGPLGWGTWELWAFSACVVALSFYVYGKID